MCLNSHIKRNQFFFYSKLSLGPGKVGKQIKTMILRENYKIENHGIEMINMQFKFKLFFTFVSNSIINIYFIVMYYKEIIMYYKERCIRKCSSLGSSFIYVAIQVIWLNHIIPSCSLSLYLCFHLLHNILYFILMLQNDGFSYNSNTLLNV